MGKSSVGDKEPEEACCGEGGERKGGEQADRHPGRYTTHRPFYFYLKTFRACLGVTLYGVEVAKGILELGFK